MAQGHSKKLPQNKTDHQRKHLTLIENKPRLGFEDAAKILGFPLDSPISNLGKKLVIGRAERILAGEKFSNDTELEQEIAQAKGQRIF